MINLFSVFSSLRLNLTPQPFLTVISPQRPYRFLDKIFSPGHNFRVPRIDGTCLL
jgi:hypothetical protein